MSSPVDPEAILELMKQRAEEMDHLIQPVIDSLFEQVEVLAGEDRKRPIVSGAPLRTPRRVLIERAIDSEKIGYQQDGASGRRFVLEVIEDYLRQMWEEDETAEDPQDDGLGDDFLADVLRIYEGACKESLETGEGAYAVYERHGLFGAMENYFDSVIEERRKGLMPIVKFSYDQHATVTCTAKCEVPQDVYDAGDDAIKDYLEEHSADWDEEDGEVVNTEFGSTCGKSTYALYKEA